MIDYYKNVSLHDMTEDWAFFPCLFHLNKIESMMKPQREIVKHVQFAA